MKKVILAALIFAAATGAPRAQQRGRLGAGVLLGNPSGGTLKDWLDETRAWDAGVGYAGRATVLYADYLWHGWDLLPKPEKGKLGAYAGLGPRLGTDEKTTFALRAIAGLDYWVQGHPIEIFLEGGPVFSLTQEHGVNADIGLGVRFYPSHAKGSKKK